MLKNLIEKFDELDIFDVNNIIIIISFILFIISLIFGNNIYIFVLMYLVIMFLSRYFYNKLIIFFVSTLPFLLIGAIILSFISIPILKIDIIAIIYILIKIWLGLAYLTLIYLFLKKKKIKFLKNNRKKFKYYTFKELRKRNYDNFKNLSKDIVEKYVEKNNINRSSDYYKVIEDGLEEKSKDNLEEFVWVNYLRFYKNKRYIKKEIFELIDILYLVIHVIILLLIWVR